jgi:predicted GNAT family acetyltransferase
MALGRGRLAPFERLPELRRAVFEDNARLAESGAQLRLEELDEDPRVVDPEGWKRRVEEECRDGYTYLWEIQNDLRFRASISAWTPDAAQVSGVYTPPAHRNRGIARRGLSELCARLLERSVAVCLFVNDFNVPALAVYRRIGFEPRADWASAFYDTSR